MMKEEDERDLYSICSCWHGNHLCGQLLKERSENHMLEAVVPLLVYEPDAGFNRWARERILRANI